MVRLNEVKSEFYSKLHSSDDLITRPFTYNGSNGFVVYFNTIVDEKWLEDTFFKQLALNNSQANPKPLLEQVAAASIEEKNTLDECLPMLWAGKYVIVYGDKNPIFITAEATLAFLRSIEEPYNERALRGSHEGFVENLFVNLNLIRRYAKTDNLLIRKRQVGKSIQNDIAVVYIQGKADPAVLKRVMTKLSEIDLEMVSSPGTLNEILQDSKKSIFPQILFTERPDAVIGNLAEGRIAVLMEGNPTALILPVSFFSFFQSMDDYNIHFLLGSFLRGIRLIALLISILFPSLYISLVAFHFEIIPQSLIVSVKSSLQNIPYPPLVEALIMEFTIELIREAGLRLPAPIGQTIGIVGGLVIGEAVVNAGLVSNMMIIVVAITAISSFVIPTPEMSQVIRLTRFPLMLAAATFGLIGVVLSFFVMLMHLIKLESFGTPYFTPLAPFNAKGLKDGLLRFPIWLIQKHTYMSSPTPLGAKRKK